MTFNEFKLKLILLGAKQKLTTYEIYLPDSTYLKLKAYSKNSLINMSHKFVRNSFYKNIWIDITFEECIKEITKVMESYDSK